VSTQCLDCQILRERLKRLTKTVGHSRHITGAISVNDLSQAQFEKKKTITINDLPLIVFGGDDPVTGIKLKNAFELSFNKTQCLSAWRKCGNVPLTMSVLEQPGVRHEVIVSNEFEADTRLDPEGHKLLLLEEANHMSCDFLSTFGCDGSQLRTMAPRCWIRDLLVVQKISLLEIVSTATVLLAMVVESSRVFHVVG